MRKPDWSLVVIRQQAENRDEGGGVAGSERSEETCDRILVRAHDKNPLSRIFEWADFSGGVSGVLFAFFIPILSIASNLTRW